MAINTPTENGVIRELALRYSDAGTVALYWNSETEEITLEVKLPSEDFTIRDIPKESALDVWHHPYAYADYALTTGRLQRAA